MPSVRPEILIWARETAGMSIDEAATKLGINDARGIAGRERLRVLEAEGGALSRPLLLKMAKVYRRPLLTFYMSDPVPVLVALRNRNFRLLTLYPF